MEKLGNDLVWDIYIVDNVCDTSEIVMDYNMINMTDHMVVNLDLGCCFARSMTI